MPVERFYAVVRSRLRNRVAITAHSRPLPVRRLLFTRYIAPAWALPIAYPRLYAPHVPTPYHTRWTFPVWFGLHLDSVTVYPVWFLTRFEHTTFFTPRCPVLPFVYYICARCHVLPVPPPRLDFAVARTAFTFAHRRIAGLTTTTVTGLFRTFEPTPVEFTPLRPTVPATTTFVMNVYLFFVVPPLPPCYVPFPLPFANPRLHLRC